MKLKSVRLRVELENKISKKNDTIKALLIVIFFLLIIVASDIIDYNKVFSLTVNTKKDTLSFSNCNNNQGFYDPRKISIFCDNITEVFSSRLSLTCKAEIIER